MIDTRAARTLRHLRAALRLVQKGWTQGTMARDADGHEVSALSPRARRFCAEGALYSASRGYSITSMTSLSVAIPSKFVCISQFNDAPETKKRDGVALLERAISQVKSMGGGAR